MPRRRPLEDEPPVAAGLIGPSLLTGLVMVCVYTAAGAMLGAVAVTASPGPDTAGGVWDALVWMVAVTLAVVAARPILRRVSRRIAVGAGGGLILAVAYGAVSTWYGEPGDQGPLLGARLIAMVAAGVLAGAWTPARPADDDAGRSAS